MKFLLENDVEFANYPFFVFFILGVASAFLAGLFGEGFLNVVRLRLMYVFIGPGLLAYVYALYSGPIFTGGIDLVAKDQFTLAVLVWVVGLFLLSLCGAIRAIRVRRVR